MAQHTELITPSREINAIARFTLRVDTRDATYVARKISLGLSLQAAELAGNNPDSTEADAALALSVKPHIVTHWLNNLRDHDMVEKETLKPTGDGIWHA